MRVLLVCNAGMSSSILIEKTKEAANKRGFDLTITSTSIKAVRDEVGNWDVCLLGPQVAYALDRVKGVLDIPTMAIEARTYAMADGEKTLDFAVKIYENR